jgi:hypothetical protein
MALTLLGAHARLAFCKTYATPPLAPSLQRRSVDQMEIAMTDKNQGEGNRDADRRYRRGVRKTVQETTEEERADRARDLSPEEQEEARRAEEQGKAKKRPASSEREI